MAKIKNKNWTYEFFIKGGKYFFPILNERWKYAQVEVKQILKILREFGIKKGKILEIACGNGRICTYLAKSGFEVYGIDFNPDYIKDAQMKAQKRNVKVNFICGDMRNLKDYIKEEFDVIINIFTSIGFYDKKTEQKIFKDVASLLKKNGIFLILDTISREWILNHFCTAIWHETGEYIILEKPLYDSFHSIMNNNWQVYRKEGKDLKLEAILPLELKIYSQNELTEMAEKAGLRLIKAYDTLMNLLPVRNDSRINMVFQKI